jgi:branched-chain amino acid transport system ATP-binding protein
VDGEDVTGLPAPDRARRGVARTFQRLEVFGSMTVFDNVLTAAELRRTWTKDDESPRELARDCLRRTGVLAHADAMADAVPTGIARLVELARALALRPRLLLLDEPSSGLSPQETEAFAALLTELAAEGTAVLLVEHDVELVMSTCAQVHVLDFGKLLAVGTPAEVQADPLVQQAYLGATA